MVREPAAFCMRVPKGVVTVIRWLSPVVHSILYPGGRNVLKPEMSSGWPLKSMETRSITPGVVSLSQDQNKARQDNGILGSIGRRNVHLALKVLHDVEKVIVNVRTVLESVFDFVEVSKRVADIQRAIAGWGWCGRGRRSGGCSCVGGC